MVQRRSLRNVIPRTGGSSSFLLTLDLPPWRDLGRCSETDPELFYPEKGHGGAHGVAGRARKVCDGCEVREQCLEWALERREPYGIWGGKSPDERRRLLGRPPKHSVGKAS